ncbi:hypothetical protein [Celeribacter sp. ULVN23_4]
MKSRIVIASIVASVPATPMLAHDGHAVLPGAHGHAEAHAVMAVVAAVAIWLVASSFKAWTAKRKEE